MSLAGSLTLQSALYGVLEADAAVAALVGGAIYEAPPAGPVPDLYVSIGQETVRDRSSVSGAGTRHDMTVSVVCGSGGFARAKEVAAAVTDALDGARPALSAGRVTALRFTKARAVRRGEVRRMDLTFRALWDED